jgi:FdhD protein
MLVDYLADGTRQVTGIRIQTGVAKNVQDRVIDEQPVALVYNGLAQVVMLVTPVHLEEFALGFSMSEGILAGRHELYDLEIHCTQAGTEIVMTVANRAFEQLKRQKRSLAGRTGCGLCGVESLQQLDMDVPKLIHRYPTEWLSYIPAALVLLPEHQPLNQVTGGAHAAAWVDADGQLLAVFEDVGRHNALDKLIGHLSLQGQDFTTGFVLLTSRASYELVRKCARLGIRMLASISAPTGLAVELADKAGMGLVSFCRGEGMVVYG